MSLAQAADSLSVDTVPLAQGRGRQIFTLVLVYAIGLGSMAMAGMLSPLTAFVAHDFGQSTAAIGWTISLFSLPAAIVSTLGGGLVDRLGARRILMLAPVLLALADLGMVMVHRMWLFDLAMVLAGVAYIGVLNGGAAMLMTTLQGHMRARGMALWATYAPVGFSVGLLLAALVAHGGRWRVAFEMHGLAMLLCALGALFLPRPAALAAMRAKVGPSALALLRQGISSPLVLLLGLASALPNMISYGTSLVAAGYLARTQGVSLAASASIVAVSKIVAVLAGSTVTGALLTRRVAPLKLYAVMAGVGAAAQLLLFQPASPLVAAVAGLMLWIFSFGALSGICMALLPRVAEKSGGAGLVSGIVNQFVSLASFLTPTLYFGLGNWQGYFVAAVAGLLLAALALRGAARVGQLET